MQRHGHLIIYDDIVYIPVERWIPIAVPIDRRTFVDACRARHVTIGLLDHWICADGVAKTQMSMDRLSGQRKGVDHGIRKAAKQMLDLKLSLQHRDLD